MKAQLNTDTDRFVDAKNWPTELEPAREFAREAINTWQWKGKTDKFLNKIEYAHTIQQLQEIVIYPLLSGEGMVVVKRY